MVESKKGVDQVSIPRTAKSVSNIYNNLNIFVNTIIYLIKSFTSNDCVVKNADSLEHSIDYAKELEGYEYTLPAVRYREVMSIILEKAKEKQIPLEFQQFEVRQGWRKSKE